MADDSMSHSRPAVSAKNWFVPLRPGREQAVVAGRLEGRGRHRRAPHEDVGHAHAVVGGVHRVAQVADAVRVQTHDRQVGRAGEGQQPGAVGRGQVEEHVVGRIDDVPVHVVTDDVAAAGDDRHRRAPGGERATGTPGPLAGKRLFAHDRLARGELLAAVGHEQGGERHAGPLGHALELLDVLGRVGAGVAQVGGGLSFGLAERQAAAHRHEVLDEEGDRGLDLRPRGLADLAADLAVRAASANVDEGDRHPRSPFAA